MPLVDAFDFPGHLAHIQLRHQHRPDFSQVWFQKRLGKGQRVISCSSPALMHLRPRFPDGPL